jgi:CubicO group peptidase (beta-lactamase class C family)
MKMRKQLSLIIFAVIILTFNIKAQQNNTNLLDYQAEILNWLDEYNVPAVGIGIIKEGKVDEYKVFGELRRGVPAVDNTIFTIASLTKPLVSMITLKLIESGQWDLDEPLCKYWIDPDIADDNRHKMLTTRHVLSHKSGLPNWRSDFESKKLEFLFEPGTKYNYSGEGFEYLGKALEQKFKKSLEQLSDSILFKPLNIKDTRYHWDNKIDESRFAFRHNSQGKEYKNQGGTTTSAAAGVLTTMEDYARFGVDVMNQAGLSNELFNEMIRTQINIKSNVDQGLGWEIIRNLPNKEYALVHEGGSSGVQTIVVLLPVSKRGMVVFTNGDEGDKVYSKIIAEYFELGIDILKSLTSMTYNPDEIKTINVANDILSKYTGSYLIESFQMTMEIIFEDNVLKLKSPYNTMVLYPESETKFLAKDDDLIIEFVTDESKKAKGFMMTFRGAEPEFSKKTK